MSDIVGLLGDETEYLLNHKCNVSVDGLKVPGPDFVDNVMSPTNRSIPVPKRMQAWFNLNLGRLSRFVAGLWSDSAYEAKWRKHISYNGCRVQKVFLY